MNRKSKIILVFLLPLIIGGIVYLHFRQRESEPDIDKVIKGYEQQVKRLNNERDSLYQELSLREQQYRHVTDSLNAAIINMQSAQTQNRTQYENRRDSIILLSDNKLYRMVTDYIERYGSRVER